MNINLILIIKHLRRKGVISGYDRDRWLVPYETDNEITEKLLWRRFKRGIINI